MMRGLIALAAALLLHPLTEAGPPSPGGTLRLAISTDPRSLDPHRLFSSEEGTLGALVFNTLYDSDREGRLQPALASALPRTAPDGLSHVIPLRRGVRFSNGDELTAEDLAYNLERMFDPRVNSSPAEFSSIVGGLEFARARSREYAEPAGNGGANGRRWIEPRRVDGLEVLDRYTLCIRTHRPDLALMKLVAKLFISSRRHLEQHAADAATQPVGTGTFVLRQWHRGVGFRFERNPQYFRPSDPRPDAVDVLVGADASTQAMMFERGEIDFLERIPDADFQRYRRDPHFASLLHIVTGTTVGLVYLNCEIPPFTNRWVRVALGHAIDRAALARVLSNRAVPARGPVAPMVHGAATDLPTPRTDLDLARSLLAQAGLPDGFESQLWVHGENPRELKIALFVQAALREIGVRVDVNPVSHAAFVDSIGRQGKVPMAVGTWTPDYDDPRNPLALFDADNISPEGSMNASFYRNPDVQAWFHAADRETDPARRLALYGRIERQVVADAACLPLVHLEAEVLVQRRVRGFELGAFWPQVHFERCWLEP